ncbi:MAG: HD domain-containing phosphohydrolase, partial [Chloroflexota bacterium]
DFESQVYHRDGRVIWVSERAQGIRDAAGRLIGFEGTTVDITEREQAEENQRRRVRELEALNVVSAALRSARTVEEALPILLDQTLVALGCEDGEITLYDPSIGRLRVAQARGWFRGLNAPLVKPGEGITGSVFVSGQAHHIVEFARDPLQFPEAAGQIPRGWGGACAPIRSTMETVGVLCVSVPLPNQVSPEEMKLLQSLADMAGTALQRMKLYEETARHLARLQALQSVDRAIASSLDKRVTLNILLDQVVSQLDVDAAGVLLLKPSSLTLEYAAGRGFRSRVYRESAVRLGEGLAGRAALDQKIVGHQDITASKDFLRMDLMAEEGLTCYYAAPLIAKGQALGVLELFLRSPREPDKEWLDFFATLADQAAIAIDNIRLFEDLQQSNIELTLAYDATIEGWSRAMDLRDEETEGHTQRVTDLTMQLARAMGLSDREIVQFRRGALLHDIGKMGVPDQILLKPDKLTDEEWEIMRRHPQFAYDMLAPIPYLKPALDIPYCHHEKWDGSGYPRGLKGEQIPLAARLFAVVDVYDALTSDRPYRAAWSKEKTLDYIRGQSGAHFDPRVAELFLRLME